MDGEASMDGWMDRLVYAKCKSNPIYINEVIRASIFHELQKREREGSMKEHKLTTSVTHSTKKIINS